MDTCSAYHHILVALKDKEKTIFITNKRIPFSLKNIGTIYQRMVTKVFRGLIGRNMEVYVDNILVKGHSFEQYLKDLMEIFEVLRAHKMRLNSAKFVFGIKAKKVFGFMVSKKCV